MVNPRSYSVQLMKILEITSIKKQINSKTYRGYPMTLEQLKARIRVILKDPDYPFEGDTNDFETDDS